MLTHVVGCAPDEVRIGMRIRFDPDTARSRRLPVFRPAAERDSEVRSVLSHCTPGGWSPWRENLWPVEVVAGWGRCRHVAGVGAAVRARGVAGWVRAARQRRRFLGCEPFSKPGAGVLT